MEGFLEANRIVEVSLNKLGTHGRSGDLSLRKTLLVSKVLNRAQDVATSAHMCLINNTANPRSSSKLLASISKVESTTAYETDCLPAVSTRTIKHLRPPSPILCRSLAKLDEEEPMDLENIISTNSVLQYILEDNESTAVDSPRFEGTRTDCVVRNKNEQCMSPRKNRVYNATHSLEWPQDSWTTDLGNSLRNSLLDQTWATTNSGATLPPVSPGKRQHREAFPFDSDSSFFCADDSKRFKLCSPENCNHSHLNGVYDHLSQESAPLLAYMIDKGFTTALTEDGWPPTFCPESHFSSSVKFNPICAF